MKFFANTADVPELRTLAALDLTDGVMTNPGLITKSGRKHHEVIAEICAVTQGRVSAEVIATDAPGMITEGKVLVIHLFLALPLNALLPRGSQKITAPMPDAAEGPPPPRFALWLLAFVFAATWFNSTAMAAHLPGLLQAAAASTAVAIAAGALIGPAQVAARVLTFGLMLRFHPLVSARLAASAHPLAAICLVVLGGPAAYGFAMLHGAGNGILTIAKGTLPLALFGAAGYGARLGWLNVPARLLQAAAPLIFGAALAACGLQAIWLTAGVGVLATAALFLLRRT